MVKRPGYYYQLSVSVLYAPGKVVKLIAFIFKRNNSVMRLRLLEYNYRYIGDWHQLKWSLTFKDLA